MRGGLDSFDLTVNGQFCHVPISSSSGSSGSSGEMSRFVQLLPHLTGGRSWVGDRLVSAAEKYSEAAIEEDDVEEEDDKDVVIETSEAEKASLGVCLSSSVFTFLCYCAFVILIGTFYTYRVLWRYSYEQFSKKCFRGMSSYSRGYNKKNLI